MTSASRCQVAAGDPDSGKGGCSEGGPPPPARALHRGTPAFPVSASHGSPVRVGPGCCHPPQRCSRSHRTPGEQRHPRGHLGKEKRRPRIAHGQGPRGRGSPPTQGQEPWPPAHQGPRPAPPPPSVPASLGTASSVRGNSARSLEAQGSRPEGKQRVFPAPRKGTGGTGWGKSGLLLRPSLEQGRGCASPGGGAASGGLLPSASCPTSTHCGPVAQGLQGMWAPRRSPAGAG